MKYVGLLFYRYINVVIKNSNDTNAICSVVEKLSNHMKFLAEGRLNTKQKYLATLLSLPDVHAFRYSGKIIDSFWPISVLHHN